MPKNKKQKGGPLKEKEDYPSSVKRLVKQKLAALDASKDQERTLYMAQDVENYLLEAGLSVKDLTPKAIAAIAKELRRRPDEAS